MRADSPAYLRPFAPQPNRAAQLPDPRPEARRTPSGPCARNGLRASYPPVNWSAAQEVLVDFDREARKARAAILDAPVWSAVAPAARTRPPASQSATWQTAPGVRYQPATPVQGARWASLVTAVVVLTMGCATGAIMMADGQQLPANTDAQSGAALGLPSDQSTMPPAPVGKGAAGLARTRDVSGLRRAGSRRPVPAISMPLPPITMLGPGLGRRPAITSPVAVAPGALKAPDAYSVLHLLSRYFGAINAHAFAAYQRLFSASMRPSVSAANFASTYGTMRDTQAALLRVRLVGAGVLAADVAFTSHQQALASLTGTTCSRWYVTLYLSRQNHRLVLVSTPTINSILASTCR